jgi:hypothetical protein
VTGVTGVTGVAGRIMIRAWTVRVGWPRARVPSGCVRVAPARAAQRRWRRPRQPDSASHAMAQLESLPVRVTARAIPTIRAGPASRGAFEAYQPPLSASAESARAAQRQRHLPSQRRGDPAVIADSDTARARWPRVNGPGADPSHGIVLPERL